MERNEGRKLLKEEQEKNMMMKTEREKRLHEREEKKKMIKTEEEKPLKEEKEKKKKMMKTEEEKPLKEEEEKKKKMMKREEEKPLKEEEKKNKQNPAVMVGIDKDYKFQTYLDAFKRYLADQNCVIYKCTECKFHSRDKIKATDHLRDTHPEKYEELFQVYLQTGA